MSPYKKLIIIFCVATIAAYICLPKEIPIFISKNGFVINEKIVRKDIDVSINDFSYQKNFDLLYGLDLAGGSHLVFEAETNDLSEEDKRTALESVKEVISRRVNLFGVSEPNIQISSFNGKDRIIVELPGVNDTKDAVDLIGQTAQLTFAEVGSEEEPGIFPTSLTGKDLKSATVGASQMDGSSVVNLEFSEEGSKEFAEITARNIGKPVAILLDTDIVSAPIVNQEITGGQAQISGDFTVESAKNLAIQLNAGALPVSVRLIEERSIGASLGAESVEKSIVAGLVGISMVLLFMVIIYGKLGFIADIGLIFFGIFTLALYKMIPVVLTLPGIAGFLLSVGMAVDSNILIFERLKEERRYRDFANALEVSFGRAWDSIRDANVATLFTAFILANPFDWPFLHTSGPVRGFAITLALGILVSLFTGVVVTRNLLRVFIIPRRIKK